MASNRIPVLTPQGHLKLAPTDEARILPDNLRDRLESAFERGAGHGLLELGIREVGTARCYVRLRNQTAAQIPHR